MRAALISLSQQGENTQLTVAGLSIAQRQLLFARQCGCTGVIAHGGGASADAVALRHAAEKAGMRYQVVSNSHALPGAIGDEDSLLVLQPDLLPEARPALDLLRAEGERVLVISAGPGTAAGFERIDLDRAWGGALTMPGRWLGRLNSLPEDAAPHAALLRICLQQKLPEARLDDTLLDDGRWMVVASEQAANEREKGWLRSHLEDAKSGALSRWLARKFVARTGAWLLQRAPSRPLLLALTVALLGGSVYAALREQAAIAFGLAASSVPILESFLCLSRLSVAPFGRIRRLFALRYAVDAVLFAICIISIAALPHRAIFPSVVLLAGMLLLDRKNLIALLEPLRDRGLIAALIAVVSVFASPEIGIMAAGAMVLAGNLAHRSRDAANAELTLKD